MHASPPRPLLSFPTRRSSDLVAEAPQGGVVRHRLVQAQPGEAAKRQPVGQRRLQLRVAQPVPRPQQLEAALADRSEEHTSELQSLTNLVCRLLLEKKKGPRKH